MLKHEVYVLPCMQEPQSIQLFSFPIKFWCVQYKQQKGEIQLWNLEKFFSKCLFRNSEHWVLSRSV